MKDVVKINFISKARRVHKDKYNYDKVNYINNFTKVIITCKVHGDFEQQPKSHLLGQGCPLCAREQNGKNNSLTTEEFIEKAKAIHGDKYNYDKVNYITTKIKVSIFCKKHGEFWQTPTSHLTGRGCFKCARENVGIKCRSTQEEFIDKVKSIHGDRYDYSKVNYINNATKVTITCLIHGDFEQTPNGHLNGAGCPICGGRLQSNTEQFISKAKEVHGDKYDYNDVNYTKAREKVIISCPKHGIFTQTPNNHLNGQGCPKCIKNYIEDTDDYIERAKQVHGDKYDYSKVNYIDSKSRIDIICPLHGIFNQVAGEHMRGTTCPKCSAENTGNLLRSSKEEFIEKAKAIHGDKYNYDKVNYITAKDKVIITCLIHGDFEQTPYNHLLESGCPICKSSRGEKTIASILDKHHIEYNIQYKLPEHNYRYRYDFYLPEYRLLIEFHGIQHYKPIPHFGGEEGFKETIERDKMKKYLAKKTGYNILYMNYKQLIFLSNEEFENKLLEILNKKLSIS